MNDFKPSLMICLSLLIFLTGCDNRPSADKSSGTQASDSSSDGGDKVQIETPETRWERGERTTNDAPVEGEFKVKFKTSKGEFVMQVHRDWAPRGAERFYQLIKAKYYDGAPFYRVVTDFMVQFGMNGDPQGTQYWDKDFPDDPVIKSNRPGMVTYAKTNAPNSRSTQLFINYGDNKFLDGQGFAPFAEITEGMDVVMSINAEYSERPQQPMISKYGNQYVFRNFPNIDYIVNAEFVETSDEPAPAADEPAGEANSSKIEFPSADGLPITADLYAFHEDPQTPFIVLCHQAGWSRGEYLEIAPKLNMIGFNCMAIDQRSGKEVNDVTNETSARAQDKSLGVDFPDAEQDMIAAIKHAREKYAKGKIILWGSSYSSALAIRIAGESPDLVDGVLAFAPGEYFQRFEKPADWIASSAAKVKVPVFITSAKNEKDRWASIFEAIPGDAKKSFVPGTQGNHGSRALWEEFSDHESYWDQVLRFLVQYR